MEIKRYVRPLVLPVAVVALGFYASFCLPEDHKKARHPKPGKDVSMPTEYDALVDDIRTILKSYKTSIDEDTKTVEDYVDVAVVRNSGEYDKDAREKARAKVGESAEKEKHGLGRFIDTIKKEVDKEFGVPKPEDTGQKTDDKSGEEGD